MKITKSYQCLSRQLLKLFQNESCENLPVFILEDFSNFSQTKVAKTLLLSFQTTFWNFAQQNLEKPFDFISDHFPNFSQQKLENPFELCFGIFVQLSQKKVKNTYDSNFKALLEILIAKVVKTR